MDEPSAGEAGSLAEEVAGERVEETHNEDRGEKAPSTNEDGGEKAPSTNECCIRISGSAKGRPIHPYMSHTLGVLVFFPFPRSRVAS